MLPALGGALSPRQRLGWCRTTKATATSRSSASPHPSTATSSPTSGSHRFCGSFMRRPLPSMADRCRYLLACSGSSRYVSTDQARLLPMLVQILGAERCIDVGVYTVRIGGVIVVDNVLRHGKVNDKKTLSIRNFIKGCWRMTRLSMDDSEFSFTSVNSEGEFHFKDHKVPERHLLQEPHALGFILHYVVEHT